MSLTLSTIILGLSMNADSCSQLILKQTDDISIPMRNEVPANDPVPLYAARLDWLTEDRRRGKTNSYQRVIDSDNDDFSGSYFLMGRNIGAEYQTRSFGRDPKIDKK